VQPGGQSLRFKVGDTNAPTSLRVWIEMLPHATNDPESHLPWKERASSTLRYIHLTLSFPFVLIIRTNLTLSMVINDDDRVDGMSETETRERLRECGYDDMAISKKNLTQLKSLLEGKTIGDGPRHSYLKKLISLNLLKCYDLQWSARNFPVELLSGTTQNHVSVHPLHPFHYFIPVFATTHPYAPMSSLVM
jgi:hypothetical protein